MAEILKVSWDDFHAAIGRLGSYIETQRRPDVILGVARGGLPGLTALASRLEIAEVAVALVRSTLTDEPFAPRKRTIHCDALASAGQLKGKRVLIFDDIIRSGRTLDAVKVELRRIGVTDTDSVALFKEHNQDLFADAAIGSETWINFPWDNWSHQLRPNAPHPSSEAKSTSLPGST